MRAGVDLGNEGDLIVVRDLLRRMRSLHRGIFGLYWRVLRRGEGDGYA